MQLSVGALLSSHEGSIAVFPPSAVSGACLGPMVSLAGSYVTHLCLSLRKCSGMWLSWHWEVLAPGIRSLKFMLLQLKYNQDWNLFLTKDL